MKKIIIYVDKREIGTRVAAILDKNCEVVEKQLDCADYLLSDRVAAERKTSQDFIMSIMDGRLFDQLSRMKDCFPSTLLIIEGGSLFDQTINIHENAIRGALASIAIDMSVPIIWTENQMETAKMLLAIAKREQLDMNKSVSIRGKKKFRSMNQQQEFLISGIEGINTSKAKSLLKQFSTPHKIFTASEEDLKNADGIGPGIAKKIRKIVNSKYEKSILEE